MPIDAILQVSGQHQDSKLIQSGPQGGDLGKDVNAISAVIHHLLDSRNLSRNSCKSLPCVLANRVIHSLSLQCNSNTTVGPLIPTVGFAGSDILRTVNYGECQNEPSAFTTL